GRAPRNDRRLHPAQFSLYCPAQSPRKAPALLAVSVVVPTYNRSTVLHNTLASVARQTAAPGPIEVIVVDDGSTQALAPAFLGQFSLPLRCLRQDNAGATRARNAGAAAATGDLLVFVDDDISLEPEAL